MKIYKLIMLTVLTVSASFAWSPITWFSQKSAIQTNAQSKPVTYESIQRQKTINNFCLLHAFLASGLVMSPSLDFLTRICDKIDQDLDKQIPDSLVPFTLTPAMYTTSPKRNIITYLTAAQKKNIQLRYRDIN